MKIVVLLATHNGAKFLFEQINSILSQSYNRFDLMISDDCSDDGTFELLTELESRHQNIRLINKERRHFGSPQKNFIHLAKTALELNYDHYFFSDQDDVWDEQKVVTQISQLSVMEKNYGIDMPLLVHSDLTIVDSDLNTLNWSFFASQRIFLRNINWWFVVCSNIVTGSTMAVNKSQMNLFLKFADENLLHDHQMAIIACRFGRVYSSALSLVNYRQHQSNTIGAHRDWNFFSRFIHTLRNIRGVIKTSIELKKYVSSFSKTNFPVFYFYYFSCKTYLSFSKSVGRFSKHV